MNDCYLISKQYRTFTGLVWQVLWHMAPQNIIQHLLVFID